MSANRSTARATREIIRLCHAGLDSRTLRTEVYRQLQRVIPYAAFWCATTDPSTSLFTSAVGETDAEDVPAFVTNELLQDDFNKFRIVAKSRQPVATLKMATQGDLSRSRRYREILEPSGLGDELRAVFRSGGAVWGVSCLHREQHGKDYTPADIAFITAIAPHLAAGLRTALLRNAIEVAPASHGPGLLLLANDLSVVAMTPGAELALAEVGDWPSQGPHPVAVLAIVNKLRALERDGVATAEMIPRTILRTRSGHWLTLHASRLAMAGTEGQIAVIIERPTPNDIAPLVLQAYALTVREQEVAALVLKGRSTEDIAARLCISTLTVQQHLKAIFDKVGVRSRRELGAQIYAHTYWPTVASDLGVSPDHWSVV